MNTRTRILCALAVLSSAFAFAQPKPLSSKGIGQKYGCTSIMEMPKITAAIDTTNGRGLVDPYYLWDNGATLRVRFFGGSQSMRDRVISYAREWETDANLKFVVVENGESDIRVNLDNKGGHNSIIGQLATSIAQNERTMNLDTTDFLTYDAMHRTVLHEFGHAIGLLHEHYSPKAGIPWNKELVYKELAQSQGWDRQTVDVNLFQEYALTYTHGTSYDKTSIMHYPVLARWTTNGYSVPWNNQLSMGDRSLISALYPKAGVRTNEAPRFKVTNFTTMNVVSSAAKGGLLIYPSFTITTAGNEGNVYFIVFFFDESGNPIMDNNQTYNVSNIVATYRSFKLLPNKTLSANKIAPTDFEMFIPYNEIPVASGTKVKAVFRAFLIDGEELKYLYSSNPVTLSLVK